VFASAPIRGTISSTGVILDQRWSFMRRGFTLIELLVVIAIM